jgi:uncharacterized protein YecE (DUF72 family)
VIYVGTCGYGYEDWKGVFYPPEVPRNERLAYYATEFDAVELDFTYYRMPTAEHLQTLAAQVPAAQVPAGRGFQFAVKAHQDITHHRRGGPAPFAQFRAAVAPLQRQERLGAVLLQFPYSFGRSQENVRYLQDCFELLPELPLVVEFRSREWFSQRTLALLREAGVGFCNVDLPELPGLPPRTAFVTAETAYVRFHGRNKKKWWVHDEAWERYDYGYGADELSEWVPHLLEMDADSERLFAFANNHWQGQSVSTARQLRMFLERQDQEET